MVETERLSIHPLRPAQLELYLQGNGRLEKLFNLRDTGRTVSPEIKEMVENDTLPKLKRLPGSDYLFLTFWIVIERSSKTIVAELGFKGLPNERGEIEIGYGTMHDQRGRGFMSEAVGGMIQWAALQPEIRTILAETDKTNKASIKIMEKNHFLLTETKAKMLWWKIDVKKEPD
jgi:[ribosomal protein S5]-alanine N-acetyltransferase